MVLVATSPGIGAVLMRSVGWPGWRAGAAFLLRRVPFTTTVVVIMLVAASATGALWTGIGTLPVYPHVAFGLPAFADGRWYTIAFGAFFALVPVYYVFVAGGFALLVGFSECRLGTGRTVVATVGGQVAGVLVAAAVLAIGRDTPWPWAARIGAMTDVGFSAGMLAAVCVASMTVSPPWGLRIRLAAAGYAGLSLLYIGLMADLEHGIAVLTGWSLARLLAGSRAVRQPPPAAGEWRVLGSVGLAVVAVLQLAVRLFPGAGPTGTAEHGTALPVLWHVVLAGIGIGAALGWYRGRPWALPLGMGLVVVELLMAAAAAVLALAGDLPTVLRVDAPTVYADAAAAMALGVLMILGRAAVGGPSVTPGAAHPPVPAGEGRSITDGAGSQK